MFRLMLGLGVLGIAVIVMGVRESTLAGKADAQPQSLTCAELSRNGPGDNAHVAMFDFILFDREFVYEGSSESDPWDTVWVPAIPIDGEWAQQVATLLDDDGYLPDDAEVPIPDEIRVIVRSKNVHGEDDLTRLGEAEYIRGVIVNEIDKLGSEEKKLLRESYPGVNFSQCWILDDGRKPAGTGKILGYFSGGGAMILLAIGGIVFKAKKGE